MRASLVLSAAVAVSSIALFASAPSFPDATVDQPKAPTAGKQTAVLAGGCFWGVDAVFDRRQRREARGLRFRRRRPQYRPLRRSQHRTHRACRSVEVTYDPPQITYGQLLKVYFAVAHDPTEVNRQGPDTGTQYRSAIFYNNDEQKKVADAYIQQLNDANVFDSRSLPR